MIFHLDKDFDIFKSLFDKRPEIKPGILKKELMHYYLPYVEKLIKLRSKKGDTEGVIVGVSAIQGAGKTTQGEILEILLDHFDYPTISLSIDDHYITHKELVELRQKDPRFIRRGVTHDINLALENLKDLKTMNEGQTVLLPIYDKGAFEGDGERVGWKPVTKKPAFIFYDGWMLGARKIEDESVFESALPALETKEDQEFAKFINKKLVEYEPLWDFLDFINVLYVPNYQISLVWRDQAEEVLREKGTGMSQKEIKEFVFYFWRSVHPAIQIKSLAQSSKYTDQVVIISEDHSIKEVITPEEVKKQYV